MQVQKAFVITLTINVLQTQYLCLLERNRRIQGLIANKRKSIWVSYKENPYDYFKQPEDWYAFDMSFGCIMHDGYDVCGLIARFAPTSDENLTDFENDELINEAINIVLDRFGPIYGFYLVFGDDEPINED